MWLNGIKPATGSRPSRKRVARGQGSDLGKTAGRGHAGQKSRSGGYKKVGFEGGQMPLQRRVPKRGFISTRTAPTEVRLDQLNRFSGEVSLATLRETGVIRRQDHAAKLLAKGTLESTVTLRGIAASAGARRAVEAKGGTISD